jgi:hypothetical protein
MLLILSRRNCPIREFLNDERPGVRPRTPVKRPVLLLKPSTRTVVSDSVHRFIMGQSSGGLFCSSRERPDRDTILGNAGAACSNRDSV